MKFLMIIRILLAGLLVFTGSISSAVGNDTSLSLNEYYSIGIPKKIQTVIDLDFVQIKLLEIAEKKEGLLPKYHSRRSGAVFKMIFSEQTIDNIINIAPNNSIAMHAHLAIQQKLDLSKYPYLQENTNNDYDFEIIYISLMDLYNMTKSLELMDADRKVEPVNEPRIEAINMIVKEKLNVYFGEVTRKTWKGISEEEYEEILSKMKKYLSRLKSVDFLSKSKLFQDTIDHYMAISFPDKD